MFDIGYKLQLIAYFAILDLDLGSIEGSQRDNK